MNAWVTDDNRITVDIDSLSDGRGGYRFTVNVHQASALRNAINDAIKAAHQKRNDRDRELIAAMQDATKAGDTERIAAIKADMVASLEWDT